MRSIFLHLRGATKAEVNHLLQRICRTGKGPEWVFDVGGESYLYIDFYLDGRREFEPEDWAALVESLGGDPAVSLIVDISGRHPGDRELKEFVSAVLSKFDGFAQDEYTTHCWTLQEIASGHQEEGHPFFDYLGWHNKRQNPTGL